jgi:hypothetical protein
MADNQSIKGIESDESVGTRRLKPRGKQRKPFTIEYRTRRKISPNLARFLHLMEWQTHSRYLTPSRRDMAFAALVKKDDRWFEYRKGGDAE